MSSDFSFPALPKPTSLPKQVSLAAAPPALD